MAQIINTNIASLNAQRNLNKAQSANDTSLQRLSSGLRINSAKDDAAGMAISTRFDSQIRGLNVAVRNAGDGMSLAQTAEGGLDSITSNLQRLRELAVQSANATNSDVDRQSLNEEAQQLKDEIKRVSEETNFNGVKLLNGDFKDANFQVGANSGETIKVSIGKATVDSLGVSSTGGVSSQGTDAALASGDLIINGVKVGASRAADDTASTHNQAASAISKAAAINRVSGETGVTAVVDVNDVGGSAMAASAQSGTVTLNGTEISIDTTGDEATSRASVVAAINAKAEQTGIMAVDSGDNATGVTLVAKDGRNIQLSFGGNLDAANTGLAAAGTYEGGFTLVAEKGGEINISGSANLANSGLAAGSYKVGEAATTSKAQVANAAAGAVITGTAATVADYGTTAATFDLSVNGGAAATITLNANYATDGDALDNIRADLQAAIDGSSIGAGAVTVGLDSSNRFTFTSTATGETAELEITNATNTGALGISDTSATGADAGFDNLDAGDLVINGSQIGAAKASDDTASYDDAATSSKQASGIAVAAAINRASGETGVTATVNATKVEGTSTTAGTADHQAALWLNGVEVSLTVQGDAEENRISAIDAINAKSGQTGVVATDNGEGITLTAADGRNIVAAFDTKETDNGGTAAALANFGLSSDIASSDITAAGGTKADADAVASTTYSTVTLSSAGAMKIEAGSNGTTALAGLGLETGTYGGAASGQYLKDVDISTVAGANKALESVDNALKQVNSARAQLGAIQNRFDATISNLQSSSENLSAANSRIRDADFAAETAEMSRTQVLQQAGISILAQANGRGQQVLSLLR